MYILKKGLHCVTTLRVTCYTIFTVILTRISAAVHWLVVIYDIFYKTLYNFLSTQVNMARMVMLGHLGHLGHLAHREFKGHKDFLEQGDQRGYG